MGTNQPARSSTRPRRGAPRTAGESGIDFIQSFDASEFPSGSRPRSKALSRPTSSLRERAGFTANVLLAVEAGRQALDDAGLDSHYRPSRVGIAFGSAIGGFLGIMEQHEVLQERGPGAGLAALPAECARGLRKRPARNLARPEGP